MGKMYLPTDSDGRAIRGAFFVGVRKYMEHDSIKHFPITDKFHRVWLCKAQREIRGKFKKEPRVGVKDLEIIHNLSVLYKVTTLLYPKGDSYSSEYIQTSLGEDSIHLGLRGAGCEVLGIFAHELGHVIKERSDRRYINGVELDDLTIEHRAWNAGLKILYEHIEVTKKFREMVDMVRAIGIYSYILGIVFDKNKGERE